MDTFNELKIPKSSFDKLKEVYLKNPKTAYSLYIEFNKTYPMDKKVFRGLLDKIRMDKGASAYSSIKKTKIGNNPLTIMTIAMLMFNIQNDILK